MERIPIKTISGIPGRDGLGLGGALCDTGKHGKVMVYNLSDVPVEKGKQATNSEPGREASEPRA